MEYLESNEMDYLQVIYLSIIGFMQRYEHRFFKPQLIISADIDEILEIQASTDVFAIRIR